MTWCEFCEFCVVWWFSSFKFFFRKHYLSLAQKMVVLTCWVCLLNIKVCTVFVFKKRNILCSFDGIIDDRIERKEIRSKSGLTLQWLSGWCFQRFSWNWSPSGCWSRSTYRSGPGRSSRWWISNGALWGRDSLRRWCWSEVRSWEGRIREWLRAKCWWELWRRWKRLSWYLMKHLMTQKHER